jgi:glycerol-3-phosphate dehydrogenase (NAD(P)+)
MGSSVDGGSRAAVLGAGNWGTTFAQVLCDADTPTVLYARDAAIAAEINSRHSNERYLPGVSLTPSLAAVPDVAAALEWAGEVGGASLVVLAVPAQMLRAQLKSWAPLIPRDAMLVSLMKGVEHGSCARMSEVITSVLDVPASRVAVVSGPNLAPEIARHELAATVVACTDPAGAELLQKACHGPYFRPYTDDDVTGCELGGAVKNVIAIAVGIAVGLGLGDNTKATLITRGLAEITRLGVAMGARPRTFAGLAVLGDLVATCSSPLSRNRSFGEKLGRGLSVAEAASMTSQTAEGPASCEPVLTLARRHGVEMPITAVVAEVLRDKLTVKDAAVVLASRSAKPEWYESHGV